MASLLLPDARVDEADWYTAALTDFGARVANIIPGGYPAYARILHPATASGGERVTWAQVAASAGTVVHPLAQFPAVAGRLYSRLTGPAGWLGSNPLEGSLDLFQLRILCSILSDDTIAGERCWATFWEGWGNLPARWRETWPRIKQPHRAYFLFERPVAEIVSLAVDVAYLGHSSPSFRILTSTVETQDAGKAHSPAPGDVAPLWVQSPNQWWPNSRAWCVATEIDFDSTLVGGSEVLIHAILSDARLEAFPVTETDDLNSRGDPINREPPG